MPRRLARLSPFPFVLIALVTRFFLLDRQSLWGDEGYTWQTIRGSLPQTLERTLAEGSQAPFYFVAQWAWSKVFGTSELGLRSLSAVAGALGVWFVYLIAARVGGQRAAMWAAVLAALSPLWVYYSQEARPYALSATLAAGAVVCALGMASERPLQRPWLAGYVLCAALAALTHYFAVFAVLATVLAVPRTRFGILAWASATSLALLPLVAWVVIGWTGFSYALGSSGQRGLAPFSYALGVAEAFANGLPSPTGLPKIALLLGGLLALVGVLGRGSPLFIGWLVAVPVGAQLIGFPSDRPGPWVRYIIAGLPAFVLLQGAGVERLWRRSPVVGALSLIALLGMSLASLAHVYLDPVLARFDFRTPVRRLAATVTKSDVVIVNKGNPAFFYYYGDTEPAPVVLAPRSPDLWRNEVDVAATEATADADRVFLVKYMPPDWDPDGYLERWLERAYKVSDEWIEHIRLISYELTPSLDDPAVQPLQVRVGDEIELIGWMLHEGLLDGKPSRVTLFWRAKAPITIDYKVFVHVVDAADRKATQHDSVPARDTRPTTQWRPGDVVADSHPLTVPLGEWFLSAGLYEPASGVRPVVRVEGMPDDSRVLLGPLVVGR